MKRVVMVGGAMFALGFSIAWLAKPENDSGVAVPSADQGNVRAGPSRRNPDSPRNTVPPRVRACLEKLDAATKSTNETDKLDKIRSEIRDLPISDIPLMIEQMSRRAGFSGLDARQKGVIGDLVLKWYEQEPQTSLDWVAAMENATDRQSLMSKIVGKEAGKDLDHAVELAKRYGTKELGGLEMPQEIKQKLESLGVESMFEVLRAFPTMEGRFESSITFADNFPFKNLAYMLTKNSKEAEHFSFFPSNFLQEWTRRDPQAAWQWVTAGENIDSLVFSDPRGFFEAYRAGRSAEEINTLILDYMSRQTDDDRKFQFAWNSLADHVDAAQIRDFLMRLPGERSENLHQMVKVAARGFGSNYDNFKEALYGMMSPQERMEILPQVLGGASFLQDGRCKQILKQLGHTDAEIQAMFSPG